MAAATGVPADPRVGGPGKLLADVLMLRPDDAELAATFERAEAVGYLRLDCLDNRLAVRLTAVIKEAAEGVWAGRLRSGIGDRFNDEQTTQEYLKGLRMLLGL